MLVWMSWSWSDSGADWAAGWFGGRRKKGKESRFFGFGVKSERAQLEYSGGRQMDRQNRGDEAEKWVLLDCHDHVWYFLPNLSYMYIVIFTSDAGTEDSSCSYLSRVFYLSETSLKLQTNLKGIVEHFWKYTYFSAFLPSVRWEDWYHSHVCVLIWS